MWKLLLCLLGLLWCSTANAQLAPLKVGTVQPMTGPLAQLGHDAVRGMQLWVDSTNSAGGILGRRIQLVVMDGGSGVPAALDSLRRLVQVERVDLLVGVCCNLPSGALHELASSTPVLFPVGTATPATPLWAQFNTQDAARLIQEREKPYTAEAVGGNPAYVSAAQQFQARYQQSPTQAALFGIAVMRTVGDAIRILNDPTPQAAALIGIPLTRIPLKPFFDEVNAPACPANQCRPRQCTPSASPCPCKAAPCS